MVLRTVLRTFLKPALFFFKPDFTRPCLNPVRIKLPHTLLRPVLAALPFRPRARGSRREADPVEASGIDWAWVKQALPPLGSGGE